MTRNTPGTVRDVSATLVQKHTMRVAPSFSSSASKLNTCSHTWTANKPAKRWSCLALLVWGQGSEQRQRRTVGEGAGPHFVELVDGLLYFALSWQEHQCVALGELL